MDEHDGSDLENEIQQRLGAEPGGLLIKGRTFNTLQKLRGMTFEQAVVFDEVDFQGGLEVSDCEFRSHLAVMNTHFGGESAYFSDCRFESSAVFRPQSAARLVLRSSVFTCGFEIAFPRTHAMSFDLRFAQISGTAVAGPLDFGQPGYQGQAQAGEVEASDLIVGKESSLHIAGLQTRLIHLGESMFQDKASLYLSDIDAAELYVNDVRTIDKATFVFDRVSLLRARFSGTNVERFNFTNVAWPRYQGRICLFQDQELQGGKYFGRDGTVVELADIQEKIIENYRQLVLNNEAKRNYESAEEFHMGEMEMMRRRASAAMPRMLGGSRPYLNAYWLYRFLSGYGTNYRRALLVLLGLFALFSFLFMLSGVKLKEGGGFEYRILSGSDYRVVQPSEFINDFRIAFALTLSIATLQKDRPMDPVGVTGSFLTSTLVILAPAQGALLLFALRRRFRRASI